MTTKRLSLPQFLVVLMLSLGVAVQASGQSSNRKPSGTLVVAVDSLGQETWLPNRISYPEGALMAPVMENLVYRKLGEDDIGPGLAQKWSMSTDARKWTFHLRKGVRWHDGWGEFTAEDVKFTFEHIMKEGSINTFASRFRSRIGEVQVVDPYTIVFHMKEPTPDFLFQLVSPMPTIIVSKKYVETAGVEKASRHMIGTGPWRFIEHKPGEHIKFEAVEQHWRKVPYYKNLVIKLVPEMATAIAMLKAGELDIVAIDPSNKAEVEKAGLRTILRPHTLTVQVMFGGIYPPTIPSYNPALPWVGKDPDRAIKVRRALSLAINKQEIIDHVLMGTGQPNSAILFAGDNPQNDPAWKPVPYDPEAAKKLLAEAGYPNGFELTLKTFTQSGRPQGPAIAEAVAIQWAKINVRAKIERVDYSVFRSDAIAHKIGYVWTWTSLRGDEPIEHYGNVLRTDSRLQFGLMDDELTKLINDTTSETDSKKRIALHRKIGERTREKYYGVPIASVGALFGVSGKIKYWPQPPTANMANFEYMTP